MAKKRLTAAERESEALVSEIMGAADRHGEQSDDPAHEAGDLQDAIRLMWAKLTPEQQRAVHNDYFQMHGHWDGREEDDK